MPGLVTALTHGNLNKHKQKGFFPNRKEAFVYYMIDN